MKENSFPLQAAVLELVEADQIAMIRIFNGDLQDHIFKQQIPTRVNDLFHVALALTDTFTMDVVFKKIPAFTNPFSFIFGKETASTDDSKSFFLLDVTISGQSPSDDITPYHSILRFTSILSYENDELFLKVPTRKMNSSATTVMMVQGDETISPHSFYQEMENYDGLSFPQYCMEILEIIENLMGQTYQSLQQKMDDSIEKFLYSNLYGHLLENNQFPDAHAVHHMYLKEGQR